MKWYGMDRCDLVWHCTERERERGGKRQLFIMFNPYEIVIKPNYI